MALATYYVILDQESIGHVAPVPKWNGAAEGSGITALKSARLITVTAESAAEAIRGVKAQYPGWVKSTLLGVAASEVTEG